MMAVYIDGGGYVEIHIVYGVEAYAWTAGPLQMQFVFQLAAFAN